MKVKNMLMWLMVSLVLLSPVSVAAINNTNISTDNGGAVIIEEPFVGNDLVDLNEDPGITPDSALWGIEVALDRIRLAMARGPNKAQLGLKIAEERLVELKAMAEAGNLDAADKAEKEHLKSLERVRTDLDNIDETKSPDSVSSLEEEIDNHIDALSKLKERIASNPNISDEVKARLRAKFRNLDINTEELKTKVENKRTRFEIKRRAEGAKEKIKVKVKGKLSPDQRVLLKELVDSIDESKIKSEFEIKCKNEDDGVNCESEVQGDLSDNQQVLLGGLLSSLEESGNRIKIKLKSEFEDESEDSDSEHNETEDKSEDSDSEHNETEDESDDDKSKDLKDSENEDESDDDKSNEDLKSSDSEDSKEDSDKSKEDSKDSSKHDDSDSDSNDDNSGSNSKSGGAKV